MAGPRPLEWQCPGFAAQDTAPQLDAAPCRLADTSRAGGLLPVPFRSVPGAVPPESPQPAEGTREPFLIGVCGGTASGKTTVCDRIMHQLQERRVVLISQVRVLCAGGVGGGGAQAHQSGPGQGGSSKHTRRQQKRRLQGARVCC